MHVPMIVHLPAKMRANVQYDDSQIGSLIDVAPTVYYLLGHRPIAANPLFGRPMFVGKAEEWQMYPRKELFLASDVRAVYGILDENGRYLYATYDAPAHSELFDLQTDPTA